MWRILYDKGNFIYADVAKLADAIALGAIGATLEGSNPFVRIIKW